MRNSPLRKGLVLQAEAVVCQGPRGRDCEVVQEGRKSWRGRQGLELEGPTGQAKEGRREPLQHPKPLKENVRFTFFTDSNLPLPSFTQVSQGMLGLGVETHPETDRKRNQMQCRLGKVVRAFFHNTWNQRPVH